MLEHQFQRYCRVLKICFVGFAPDSIPPSVTLLAPTNRQNLSSTSVSLNCSMTDSGDGLKNSTLYGNWSGWHANDTKTVLGASNYTNFTKIIPEGSYKWNCYVCDQAGNCNFSTTNRTFRIDSTGPSVKLVSPANDTWQQSGSTVFKYTPTDAYLRNCTLYGDFGAIWAANQSNILS